MPTVMSCWRRAADAPRLPCADFAASEQPSQGAQPLPSTGNRSVEIGSGLSIELAEMAVHG